MLRLPKFELCEPSTAEEAVAYAREGGDGAQYMAGGTDLLPNMKHEITTPKRVVGLWKIHALREIKQEGETLRIGALVPLHNLATHPLVRARLPSLAQAAQLIAGPQLRRMGTVGGNICLDTRCVYINQSHFWRSALGFCLKKDGTGCHVVKGGKRCVAAASNDSAPPLMTLDAKLGFLSHSGPRLVPINEFYSTDGVFNQKRHPHDLLTHVDIKLPDEQAQMGYAKLRTRGAIDFPELGVAVLFETREEKLTKLRIAITALAARPVLLATILDEFVDRTLNETLIDEVGEAVQRKVKPLTNIATDPEYRRAVVPVFVKRAFAAAGFHS